MSTDAAAYHLFWDVEHIKGTVYDATLVPFPRWEVTQHSDYPSNDVTWPLMSPRMLEVLCQVGDFPHRRIPVRLVNRRALGPAR